MLNGIKKSNKGFTIIEVLIVLAIAGLIILIVFLAVPALQRNSRNTQRKNDVAALMGGVQEYASNNNGALPTTSAQVIALAKTGYYSGAGTSAGQINLEAWAAAYSQLTATAANDRVKIVTGATCSGTSVAQGSAREVATQYLTETSGGGWNVTCQSS